MNKELIINTYEDNILLFKENLIGSLENDILRYENENDSFVIDLQNQTLIKENLESILEINPEKAILTVKELEKTWLIPLNSHTFIHDSNKIIISYLLESQEKPLKIEIEMSEEHES